MRQLSVGPGDKVLEIGCGAGSAVAGVCRELTDGRITAIDRSAALIRLAERRNGGNVLSGKAVLRVVAWEDWDPRPERFDKIFAVNVSLFWLASTQRHREKLRRCLAPGGSFFACYQLPDTGRMAAVADRLAAALAGYDVRIIARTTPVARSTSMLCLAARDR